MAGTPTIGWAIFGTFLCGLVLTIPVIIVYYIVRMVQNQIKKRKERIEKESTVI
ncbi:MAG: hypothetical protein ACTSXO_06490 [Candidatus Heimdallarchaeota archaeon]|nr:hypothetical protein [Candidatus Heimdallarchaeota archaeon]